MTAPVRMSPEQFHEKLKLDAEHNHRRQRIALAARFLASGLSLAGQRDEAWAVEELRQHARGALKVADILLEEAARVG